MSEKKIDDGGPAFPQCVSRGLDGGVIGSYDFIGGSGMTLRDRIAIAALQGMLASEVEGNGVMPQYPKEGGRNKWMELTADDAYSWADAMLVARKKEPA